ncbi:MAG: PAS domain S-box protein [Ignavibacteria bacterium]
MSSENQKTLLLVEDEVIIAMSNKRDLEKSGYKIIIINTGEKAIEIFKKNNSIDLILMDINLGPGIDGTETAIALLKERVIPVIFLSGHTEPEIVKKTEKIPFYGYVVKNSGIMILDASIKMAFRLFESRMTGSENDASRRRIYESSKTPTIILDSQNYEIIDCNPAAVSIYAFSSREEILGKTPLDVSAPQQYDGTFSSEKVKYFIDKALAEDEIIFEWLHQRPDGKLWDAEVRLMSFYSNGQKFLQFTLQDITNRKQVEKSLRESEELHRILIEQSPIAIEFYNPKGMLVNANPACLQLFGVTDVNEISQFSLFDDPNLSDDSKDSLRLGKNIRYQAVFDFDKVREFNLYHTTKSGLIWLDILVTTIKDNEEAPSGYLLQIQDITERKWAEEALQESEEKHRLLVENSHNIIYTMTSDGVFVFVSPAWTTLLGHPITQVIGQSFKLFVHPEDVSRYTIWLRKVIATEQQSVEIEYRIQHNKTEHGTGTPQAPFL